MQTYTYLGIIFHENLRWKHHVNHLLARGEARVAACLTWTASEDLPVCLSERIFQTYVRPSASFGLEFVMDEPELQRLNAKLFQWGRRLLMWPRGAPTAAVQGQLGWLNIQCSRLLRVAGLWARLLCVPPSSWGIGPGTPVSVVHRWLRHVKVVVCRYSDATYHAALLATESLSSFAHCQPVPNLPYNRLWQACAPCACPLLGAGEMRPSLFR